MRKTWAAIAIWMRQGLPALALYALVLQAFLTGAAPAGAFHPEHAPLCAEAAHGAPVPMPSGTHVDCLCLAQCLQAHASLGVMASAAHLNVARDAMILVHALPSDGQGHLHPLERGPGARAPPMI